MGRKESQNVYSSFLWRCSASRFSNDEWLALTVRRENRSLRRGKERTSSGQAKPRRQEGRALAWRLGRWGICLAGGPVLTGALCLCDLHLLQAGRHPRWHARAWLSWGEHARAHVGPALCRQPGSPVLPPQLFAENWVGSVV